MLKRTLLSRIDAFQATHGITDDKKEYLSLIKNQDQEKFAFAYALTSTIEMSYAFDTGNRYNLDPQMIYNVCPTWWKDNSPNESFKHCTEYGSGNYYDPICAIEFMTVSGRTMKQVKGGESFIKVSESGKIKISSVKELESALSTHNILFAEINNTRLMGKQIVKEYFDTEDKNVKVDHAVVITACGKVQGEEGIYVEILNSNGFAGNKGFIHYVKVADSADGPLKNNMKMFDTTIYIYVNRLVETEGLLTAILVLSILFAITLFVTIIISIVFCVFCCKIKKQSNQSDSAINIGLTA